MHTFKDMGSVLILFTIFCRVVCASALEVIQAQVPPRTSFNGSSCKQTIVEHTFANSYGVPYVGKFFNLNWIG
jgi:hypothetical protein